MGVILVIRDGGREHRRPLQTGVTIGRSPGNDVQITDGRVSKHHATIRREGDDWLLEDLETRNGTTLNGRRVRVARLAPGDEITVGPCRLTFEVQDETPERGHIVESISIGAGQPGPPSRDIKDEAALRREYELLRASYALSVRIGLNRNIRGILGEVLAFCCEELPADAGVVLLATTGGGELVPALTSPNNTTPSLSRSVTARIVERREALLIADRSSHMSLMAAESLMGVRSLLAVPFLVDGKVGGAIVLENERALEPFTKRHLHLLVGIASQVSLLLERAQLVVQVRKEAVARANFARFLPPALVRQVQANEVELAPGGRMQDIVVLFTDIRGFTSMSERIGAESTVQLLNAYLTSMVDSVFAHGGTLDKFIGDAVMATWGAPVGAPSDRERALSCAIDMLERVDLFNAQRPDGWERISIGIGINAGPAAVGLIGSPRRLEYTSIGDTVNVASRLCSEADASVILAHESVVSGASGRFRVERQAPIAVKGKARPLVAYRVLGRA